MLQEVRLFKNLVHNLLGTRILHLFTVKRKTLKKNERQEEYFFDSQIYNFPDKNTTTDK